MGLPIAVYFVMGERSAKLFGELHDLDGAGERDDHGCPCLVIGAKLIGDAIGGVAG